MTQPADRRVVGRPEPTRRQPEEVQPLQEAPKTVHRAVTPPVYDTKAKKPLKRFILPIAATIIILGLAGWFVWSNTQNTGMAIDKTKYQAVFFTNGQVYFGKLHVVNNDYVKLTDIYYLQTQKSEQASAENPQATTTDQNNVQLIKLGDEIHGPEDQMIISKDQMLFYENLKSDGKVAQSIEKYTAPK